LIEQGERFERSPEEKQRRPADSEAVEGMGPISTHKGENLMPTDRGISLYRRRVRRQIRDLATEGKEPPQPLSVGSHAVRTYGQDTVLHLPPQNGIDDRAYLMKIGEQVMDMEFRHEASSDATRDSSIIAELKEIEVNGVSLEPAKARGERRQA
jgi:hypothetical protein